MPISKCQLTVTGAVYNEWVIVRTVFISIRNSENYECIVLGFFFLFDSNRSLLQALQYHALILHINWIPSRDTSADYSDGNSCGAGCGNIYWCLSASLYLVSLQVFVVIVSIHYMPLHRLSFANTFRLDIVLWPWAGTNRQ